MHNMLTSGRIAFIAALVVALSACSNTPTKLEMAQSFADHRAKMLDNLIPIELNGYNLMRARAKGTQIVLTLLYTGNGDISPIPLANSLQKTYCRDNEILSLLEKGLTYKLFFRDARGKPILERVIAIGDCLNAGIEPIEKRKVL